MLEPRLLLIAALLCAASACDVSPPKNTSPPTPLPSFDVRGLNCDDGCTTLTDFCIQAKGDLCNSGNAAGTGFAHCSLDDVIGAVATRSSEAIWLQPGQCRPFLVVFQEAQLGTDYACRCF